MIGKRTSLLPGIPPSGDGIVVTCISNVWKMSQRHFSSLLILQLSSERLSEEGIAPTSISSSSLSLHLAHERLRSADKDVAKQDSLN